MFRNIIKIIKRKKFNLRQACVDKYGGRIWRIIWFNTPRNSHRWIHRNYCIFKYGWASKEGESGMTDEFYEDLEIDCLNK